ERVEVLERNRSRWTIKAPAGATVTWDAEIINDKPGELIAWRTVGSPLVEHAGSVTFAPAGDGTLVRVSLQYDPPGGRFGDALEVGERLSELVCNAVELAIDSASLENDRGETIRATPTMDEAAERCHLALASPAAPGRWRLRLAFRGTLNDKLRGFYRSVYKDPSGVSRTMAATQFEATDARRAFPCWDEPSFKAVFAVTLAIDPALTAVSNTSIVGETLE